MLVRFVSSEPRCELPCIYFLMYVLLMKKEGMGLSDVWNPILPQLWCYSRFLSECLYFPSPWCRRWGHLKITLVGDTTHVSLGGKMLHETAISALDSSDREWRSKMYLLDDSLLPGENDHWEKSIRINKMRKKHTDVFPGEAVGKVWGRKSHVWMFIIVWLLR